jgi:hypothetical protein
MMKNENIMLRNLLLFVSILALIITFTNCKVMEPVVYSAGEGQDVNEYQIFIVPEEETIRFSFEYSISYGPIKPQSGPFGLVISTGGVTFEELDRGKKNDIVIDFKKGDETVETAMKKNISRMKWQGLRNFRLIQKHRVNVNGYEGWETVMTFRERVPLYRGAYATFLPPAFIIQRDIFISHEGITYRIEIAADEESYEQNKGDFEHILKTFKIIE